MADNPTVNGVVVAGDDVGSGIIVQRVKLNHGADGTGGAATDVAATNPLPTHNTSRPVLLANNNTSGVWANSAAANTVKDIVLDNDTDGMWGLGHYLVVIIRNPSTETAINGRVQVKWTDLTGPTDRFADLSTPADTADFTVLANNSGGQAFVIENAFISATLGGNLQLKNNTTLSGSGGFTASVQVWAI